MQRCPRKTQVFSRSILLDGTRTYTGRHQGQGRILNLVCPAPGRSLGVFSRGGSPLSKQQQLIPLKTFPCSCFILNEAKHIGHAAHRHEEMSAALDTVMYFVQEARLCRLICHPSKVRSKKTEGQAFLCPWADCPMEWKAVSGIEDSEGGLRNPFCYSKRGQPGP